MTTTEMTPDLLNLLSPEQRSIYEAYNFVCTDIPAVLLELAQTKKALAEARKDSGRLDWIDRQPSTLLLGSIRGRAGVSNIRAAIDAAKEGK